MPPKGQDERPKPQQESKVLAIRRLADVEQGAFRMLRRTHEAMI